MSAVEKIIKNSLTKSRERILKENKYELCVFDL
jgi:hypothetical protein